MILQTIEDDSTLFVPNLTYALYKYNDNVIVLDAKKLSELVGEISCMARDAGVDFGDLELVCARAEESLT